MNHQPFRGWLLAEEELSVEQARALQEHMQNCDACQRIDSSWKELEAVINRSQQFEPAPGFAVRWQIRLVEQQHHQQQLRGWYTIGATALASVALMVFMVMQIWALIQAPGPYLAGLFDRLLGVMSILFAISDFASTISFPGPLITLAAIVLLVGLISFMSVLWLATYRKFTLARRQV